MRNAQGPDVLHRAARTQPFSRNNTCLLHACKEVTSPAPGSPVAEPQLDAVFHRHPAQALWRQLASVLPKSSRIPDHSMHQGCATELSKHAKLMAASGEAAHSSEELYMQCIIWIDSGVKGMHMAERKCRAPRLRAIAELWPDEQ